MGWECFLAGSSAPPCTCSCALMLHGGACLPAEPIEPFPAGAASACEAGSNVETLVLLSATLPLCLFAWVAAFGDDRLLVTGVSPARCCQSWLCFEPDEQRFTSTSRLARRLCHCSTVSLTVLQLPSCSFSSLQTLRQGRPASSFNISGCRNAQAPQEYLHASDTASTMTVGHLLTHRRQRGRGGRGAFTRSVYSMS